MLCLGVLPTQQVHFSRRHGMWRCKYSYRVADHGGTKMGIHYDYKSTRGAKKIKKQQQREERRRRKKRDRASSPTQCTVPEDTVLTLDMITDPNR